MENTGLILDPRPIEEKIVDYSYNQLLSGTELDIDQEKYIPEGRPQNKIENGYVTFDTLSCVSFSCNTCTMARFNYSYRENIFSDRAKNFLTNNGYIENGKVVFSDRFLAIMSGTTKQGNYVVKVCDSARNDGLIPNSLFPFGGNSFEEYHDKSLITKEMKQLGCKFKFLFNINYGWLFSNEDPTYSNNEKVSIGTALKHAPVLIGVPITAGHCIAVFKDNPDVLDHYPPFIRRNDPRPINFAMGFKVTEKIYPKYKFTQNLQIGSKGEDVKKLQEILIIDGCLEAGNNTGFYGGLTANAVKKLQEKYAECILKPLNLTKGTGLFYNSTREFINSLIK